MKTKSLLLAIAVFFISFNVFSQLTFSVSPGLNINGAQFGYKVNSKIIPCFGFQYLNGKGNFKETGKEYDYDLNIIQEYSEKGVVSASIYIPNIGVKYFFKQVNKVNAYFLLNVSKPFISGKSKYDGEDDPIIDEDYKKLGFWGADLGFGMEYFFDDNFSLGGEFGIRHYRLFLLNEYENNIFNPDTGGPEAVTIKQTYNFSLTPTYSKIALNFYF